MKTASAKPAPDIEDEDENYLEPDGEMTIGQARSLLKEAWEAKKPMIDEMEEDFEFYLGKQWDDDDVQKLRKVGVRALTINKCAAHVQLLKGIESQNRSDFHAFPEGEEDSIKAEIATRLVKNVDKRADSDFKQSDMFEDGNACGEGWLEPYVEYPFNIDPNGVVDVTGRLCWRKAYYDQILIDPSSREYDLSDAGYALKITTGLTEAQLCEKFPDMKDDIEEMEDGTITLDTTGSDRDSTGTEIQHKGWNQDSGNTAGGITRKKTFDLVDLYYKKYVTKYFVAYLQKGQVKQALSEAQADNFVRKANAGAPKDKPVAKKIVRVQPEMWSCFWTGDMKEFLYNGPAWTFPRWTGMPFFGYFCFRSDAPLKGDDRKHLIQGVTRRIKDLNRELNKRRTQELRHLNSSTNSGWVGEEDAFIDENKWESLGSAPGVVLKYKNGHSAPIKVTPTPLSQGHSQLAAEHQQDMRDAIGVNPETLAIEADQSSGRAIALRQKQGMVLVQGQFDNYARTRRQLGRFKLAILADLYTVETGMRVLGEAFLQENFQSPIQGPGGQPLIDLSTGQPATQYDPKLAADTVNQVLTDASAGLYDFAVGENISTETVQMANYLQLMDMAEKGLPIPPEVIVEESTLSEQQKKRIIAAVRAQAQAQISAPAPKKKAA